MKKDASSPYISEQYTGPAASSEPEDDHPPLPPFKFMAERQLEVLERIATALEKLAGVVGDDNGRDYIRVIEKTF